MQKRIVAIVLAVWGIVSLASAQTQTTFSQFSTPDAYINDLLGKLLDAGDLQWGKRAVVERFCATALWARMAYTDAVGNVLIYDPRQSIFLYTLCTHMGTSEASFYEPLTKQSWGYVKLRKLEDFGLICEQRNDDTLQPEGCIPGCDATSVMANQCDFSALLPKMFQVLMNDYSNGALALVYGAYDIDSKTLDELANDFAFQYLDGVLYTDKFTEYPNTHEYLKKFLKRARKLTAKTKIIDLKSIITAGRKLEGASLEKSCWDSALANTDPIGVYDLFACPYSNASIYAQNRIKFAGYVNLMYNEMMRYQLFVQYYSYMLQANKIGLQDFAITQRATESWGKIDYEIMKLKKDIAVHQEATKATIRMLTNIHATFAVHIGLQMYYEEAKKFRNALAKIYTPLHQLYYKLRNVQAER